MTPFRDLLKIHGPLSSIELQYKHNSNIPHFIARTSINGVNTNTGKAVRLENAIIAALVDEATIRTPTLPRIHEIGFWLAEASGRVYTISCEERFEEGARIRSVYEDEKVIVYDTDSDPQDDYGRFVRDE